jgi:hypothetical protein
MVGAWGARGTSAADTAYAGAQCSLDVHSRYLFGLDARTSRGGQSESEDDVYPPNARAHARHDVTALCDVKPTSSASVFHVSTCALLHQRTKLESPPQARFLSTNVVSPTLLAVQEPSGSAILAFHSHGHTSGLRANLGGFAGGSW